MAKLLLTHNGVVIKSYPLEADSITIGRQDNLDIQIDDAAVSARHARVVREPDKYLEGHWEVYIEDLGSTNGTLVNDLPVTERLRLNHGDVISIGRHEFTFHGDDGANMDDTAIYLPDND
ncbi:MAG: FHA domain-containing protein [Gammaproteobacteria bacterium]